jgi:hypothetical protein
MSHKPRGNTLYNRASFITLGGGLLLLPILIWAKQGERSHSWPLFAWILFFCLPIFGLISLIFGITASDDKIDSRAYIPPTPNGLIMAILVLPVYFVMKGFKRKSSGRK